MKNKLLVGLIFISCLLFPFVLAATKEECEVGGGTWTTPENIDLREGDTREPYCKCEQGSQWNGEICEPIPQKVLCESSDGKWMNNKCICPENSVGWNENKGCDYTQFVQSKDINNLEGNKIPIVKIILVTVLLFLIVFIIVEEFRRYFRKKNRQNELKDEKN